MTDYKLSDAVTLFSQHITITNNLWQIYVVATFAAAGYGISGSVGPEVATFVTAGFWLFALGHLRLLTQSLQTKRILSKEIKEAVKPLLTKDSSAEAPFAASLQQLADTVNPPWVSILMHLGIDICVTVALWSRVGGVLPCST